MIFDGMSRKGELEGFVCRYLDADGYPRQRVFDMITVATSMSASALAGLIGTTIIEFFRSSSRVVGLLFDAASVNVLMADFLSGCFKRAMMLKCCSHACNNAGDHLVAPVLICFMMDLNACLGMSPSVANSACIPTFNNTRWWSMYECMRAVLEKFEHIPNFLSRLQMHGYGKKHVERLSDIMNDLQQQSNLRLQLAAVVDGLAPLVQATYMLEGEGF